MNVIPPAVMVGGTVGDGAEHRVMLIRRFIGKIDARDHVDQEAAGKEAHIDKGRWLLPIHPHNGAGLDSLKEKFAAIQRFRTTKATKSFVGLGVIGVEFDHSL